jgi:hypothetical protein
MEKKEEAFIRKLSPYIRVSKNVHAEHVYQGAKEPKQRAVTTKYIY